MGSTYLASTSKVGEPQKQRSFQMSAPEDFQDMDDDSPSNDVALSTPLSPSSSVSVPASTAAPGLPGQSATSVSVPASISALRFSGQSVTSPAPFVFGSSGSTGLSSGSIFGSFSAIAFSSGPGSTSSSLGSSFTSSSLPTSSSTTSIFGVTSQSPKPASTIAPSPTSSAFPFGLGSTSIFGVTSQSPKPASTIAPSPTSSAFPFGLGSSGAASSTPVFRATSSAPAFVATPSIPVFGATSSAYVFGAANSPFQSQPAFGNSSSQPFTFASTPSTNNEQMTMEYTMAEDSSQPSTPPPRVFGAPISVPSSGFAFNATPAPVSTFW